jgi:hypothetical protein
MAEKMVGFLPQPAAGLIDRLPWDDFNFNQAGMSWGCGEADCPSFSPVKVHQKWRFDDLGRVQQVEAAEKQVKAELKVLFQQKQELAKRSEVRWKEWQECMKERSGKVTELARQGKFKEMEKVPMCPEPKDPEMEKLDAKQKELERRVPRLKDEARSLEIELRANQSPPEVQPIGALKGQPLYRYKDVGYKDVEYVGLAIYLGPKGFRNPWPARDRPKEELKSILVHATIQSTPETLKSDESVARQMLEKMDYAGLMKLLQP